jgi:hypothetical protein
MIRSYFLLRISLLIIIFNLAGPGVCYSQNKVKNYFINISLGVPGPTSETTFKTYWFPVVDISLSGLRRNYKNLYAGLGFDYSRFNIGDWIHLKSRLHIINPNILVGYDIPLLKRFKLFPDFSFGYSWMTFTNPITPTNYIQSYNESGFSIKPGLSLAYLFKNEISLGLTGSYKIIFKKFGSDNIELYENRKEADYTSYFNLGIHCGFNF